MWCASCQTDVAGEVSADGQSVLCTSCHGEVSSTRSLSLHPKTRDARELLERWSTEELLDPDLPLPHATRNPPPSEQPVSPSADSSTLPHIADEPSRLVETAEPVAKSDRVAAETEMTPVRPRRQRRTFRLDDQHSPGIGSTAPVPAPHPQPAVEETTTTRLDNAHESAAPPHFNIASAFEGKKRPGQGESLWGQILAYGGVGLLTIGTVLVLWGYFGGPESYTPTGWLLASAGQMLLFLGIVTLVSGGMEQTTHEVSRRIEYLGDQLVRFEQAQQHALKGPHYATRDESDSRQRETADSHHSRSTET